LVAPAGARDAARADLPLLRDVAPELGDVLVVDLVDLVAAEVAALPSARSGGRARAPAACRLLLGHLSSPRRGCRRRRARAGRRRPHRPLRRAPTRAPPRPPPPRRP